MQVKKFLSTISRELSRSCNLKENQYLPQCVRTALKEDVSVSNSMICRRLGIAPLSWFVSACVEQCRVPIPMDTCRDYVLVMAGVCAAEEAGVSIARPQDTGGDIDTFSGLKRRAADVRKTVEALFEDAVPRKLILPPDAGHR